MTAIDCWIMAIFICYPTTSFPGAQCKLSQVSGTTYPDTHKNRFLPGESVLVKCNRYFWFSFIDQSTQKTITCTGSGEWDTAETCEGRQHYFHLVIAQI